MIKHIIFDLDGVLVDAREIHAKAFISALSEIAKLNLTQQEHDRLCGLPTKIKLRKLGIPDGNITAEINRKKQQYTLQEFDRLGPDLELIDMCKSLKVKGLKLSCASNSVMKTVELALYRLGIKRFFDFWIGNDCIWNPKPSPEMYYKCMLAVTRWVPETLIVEDSPYGIEAAQASGCQFIQVLNRQEVTLTRILNEIT